MNDVSASNDCAVLMHIELAYSPAPRVVELFSLRLPAGSTVRAALQASGWADRVAQPANTAQAAASEAAETGATSAAGAGVTTAAPTSQATVADTKHGADARLWHGLSLAVFGRKLTLDSELFDGDRLDLCRPLRVDPKLARRERFNQQGSRRSGLFARRREGSVAGY
jgi:putative ubiquitin-RnfH superfamily antitoxin RatB of RatAB toxin-antitoxin module